MVNPSKPNTDIDLNDINQLQAFAVIFMGLSIDEFRDLIPVDFAEHMRFFELKEDAKRDREWEQVRYIAHKVIIANYLDPKQLPKDEKELFRLPREEQEYQEDSENFNKNMENFNWDAPIRL